VVRLHASRSSTFFFFQAEDGIRDFHVTGVQTCALPILQKELLHCYVGNCINELLSVSGLRVFINFISRPYFLYFPFIHHNNAVTKITYHAQIMTNKNNSKAEFFLKVVK